MKDKIIFGNAESELKHGFSGASSIVGGENGESARVLLPTEPVSRYSTEFSFTMQTDPTAQNYISVKMWSGDAYTPAFVYIDGKQLGYAKCGDYEALSLGYGCFSPSDFFFVTGAIPLSFTHGKTELRLTIRQAQPYDTFEKPLGRFFAAYTHTEAMPCFDGAAAARSAKALPHEDPCSAKIDGLCRERIQKQREAFNTSLELLRSGEKISITKYVESFRQFCMTLYEPYCPAEDNAQKGEAVRLILNCIDLYVRDYYANVRSLARTSHQSDWGGYYGELGQGLYILEPLIDNPDILGREAFDAFLAEDFACPTEDGGLSLCGSGITRRQAWERCLKANFDFASARQSYIYNQTYYTYEGAWKSMAGLGVIRSEHYIGKEKCDRIMLEALGLAEWRGEHILTDRNGRELDLYHCLFHHDKAAVFTDDFINIVCRGEAVQLKDENGEFVRRRPYGENYFPLSLEAMSRENGYVGNYGETANYMPEWAYRTWNHGDKELSDKIMRYALKNLHSRSFMRYQSVDSDGCRIMHMEQGTDERNPAMPGKIAYGADINDGRSFLFASFKRHMEENPERYTGKEWDEYKLYADEALGFLRQQHLDGRLLPILEAMPASYNDFRLDRTIRDIFGGKLTHVLPHTDFSLYEEGELTVNPSDYAEFAWTDIDNLSVSMRDGGLSIIAQLNLRNRGYCGVGRAHIIQNGETRLIQFATDGIFAEDGLYLRPQNVNMDFIYDKAGSNSFARAPQPLREFGATPQALCGEEVPITYQPGIGHVLRENLEVDTPFSGYPDAIWTRLGKYFIIFNTTRASYRNKRSFKIRVPESGSLYDLVSKREINAENGYVEIPPLTAMVLRLNGDEFASAPSRVNVLNALADSEGILLSWKLAAGGERYKIYKNGTLLTESGGTMLRDRKVEGGKEYTYSVSAANAFGEGAGSCEKTVAAIGGTGLVPISIGNCGGRYEIDGSCVKISEGTGFGFGEGNDYRALERSIRDSLCFAARAHGRNFSVTAAIEGEGGVMLRESGGENARYCFLGFDGSGKIVLRTRSKNTMYKPDGEKISPMEYYFENRGERFLTLVCDGDLQSVAAYASADGKNRRLLWRDILPFPTVLYGGVAAVREASFTDIEIRPETLDLPFPIRGAYADIENGACVIYVDKGLDNRTLKIERSSDGESFETVAEGLIASEYTDINYNDGDVYRITPFNRHGIAGSAVTIHAGKEDSK